MFIDYFQILLLSEIMLDNTIYENKLNVILIDVSDTSIQSINLQELFNEIASFPLPSTYTFLKHATSRILGSKCFYILFLILLAYVNLLLLRWISQ